jgi:sigma-B regulation protein RsbU (phosphoserine phosphatase)
MVSAYGDMENIRTAMNRGAYDFITKPINFEDLEKTIEKTLDEIRQIRFLQEEKKKRGIEDDDKEVSREIQRAILPKAAPEYRLNKTFTIEGLLIPSNDTACSFYDYFKVDPTNLGFVIGDVCSHCLSSAIFMAITRTLIRATGEKGLPSAKCLNYVNSLLCHEGTSQMYSSICYGVLNIETGELDYATAGQYSPIIYLNDGNSITLPATDLQRLGIDKHHKFNSNLVKIEPGSMIFLYTQNLLKSNEQDLNSQIGEHGFALAKTLATKKLSPDYKKEIERTLLAPGEKKPNVDIAMLSVCI